MLILNGSLKAYFNDGYIIDEEKQKDIAVLISEKNSLAEIIFLIENPHIHGHLVKLICRIGKDNHEINWKVLPSNSKPVRIRFRSSAVDSKITSKIDSIEFGYMYKNNVGELIKHTNIYHQDEEIR